MKIGFVFAGQGAQCTGMGKDFYDAHESARAVFDRANLALGYDLKTLCFEGPQETLNQTEITQPAILTTSVAMMKTLQAQVEITPDAVCGLSLGEYTAHVAAGSLVFEDAVQLVQKRGKFMQEAVPIGVGGMIALVGASVETAEAIAREASNAGCVEVCNYNSPKQTVLGGALDALAHAKAIATEKGVRRVIDLPVSAPFHTSMLADAETNLRKTFETTRFYNMETPVISNVDGRIVASEKAIAETLARQVTSSVRWIDCIDSMKKMGIETIVEFGPGKALSGFIGKIDRSIKVISIYDMPSLKEAVDTLKTLKEVKKAI